MKRITLVTAAGVAAAALALTACGSSGSSQTGGGQSGGTSSGSGSAGSGNTVASQLTFGGPAEFKTRAQGLAGLQSKYGVSFGNFQSLDAGGPLTINALKNGQIQAGNIFTTDPSIKSNNFVALEDPKNLFAAQNIIPLINKSKATAGVTATLKAVDDKLTTNDLIDLNTKVQGDQKEDPAQAAKEWLSSAGLDKSGTQASGATLVVGSANFQENVVLANIYAQALQAQGASVSTKLNIGSREAYVPGLQDGSIDLIPDYSGNLMTFFDKTATASTSDDVYAQLQKVVPSGLTVLDYSKAEDKDSISVTSATAQKYGLKSIADLAKSAS